MNRITSSFSKLWHCWQVRNDTIFASKKISIIGSVKFLEDYWNSLCNIRQEDQDLIVKGKKRLVTERARQIPVPKSRPSEIWKPPDPGWVKINVDGAFSPQSGDAGVGIIIRDQKGSVLLSSWRSIHQGGDPKEVEAWAYFEGVKLAAEWIQKAAVLETDCASLVYLLFHPKDHHSRLMFIVPEVLEMASHLLGFRIRHTKREQNGVAHELAQLAKRLNHCAVWREQVPFCIEHLVAQEYYQTSE